MAEPNKPAYRGSGGFRNWVKEYVVDRGLLHNRAYDPVTRQWDPRGVKQGLIQTGVGAINPALGPLAGLVLNRMNRNHTGMPPLGLDPATLAPVGQLPFTYTPQRNIGTPGIATGTQPSPTFNPNNPFAMPTQPTGGSAPTGTNWGRFTPNIQPATGGFHSLLPSNMGGARGQFTGGGITGEPARAMFASMQDASRFAPIDMPMTMGSYQS